MNTARTLFALFAAIAIGLIGYQIGLSQNVAAQIPAGAAPVAYWYGPHMYGFGFFGLLVPLILFFIFFGILRAALGGGRGWGGHHWESRRARLEELHNELHGQKPASPTDQRA